MAWDYSQLNWNHYIQKAGFTDAFVAEKVGLSRAAIGQFRRGEKRPSKETARKMRELLQEHYRAQIQFHESELKKLKFEMIAFEIHEEQEKKSE